jgi:hypothetical protein
MGPAGAASRVLREARSSGQVAHAPHRRRRLLPIEKRLCLEDVAKGIPTVANGLLPLSQVVPGWAAAPSPRPTAGSGVREAEGRARDPSGAILDSQAVKSTGVGGPERGYDGAKRLAGRKRHLLVDTGGLVLGAHVHAANLHDRDGGQKLLTSELKEELPQLAVVWADAAYTGRFRQSGLGGSEDGMWRCHDTRTGSCGATG